MNTRSSTLRIHGPWIFVVGLGLFLVLIHTPLEHFLFPGDSTPNNSGLGSYITVAGLVYALSFANSYQSVYDRFTEIRRALQQEISLISTMCTYVDSLNGHSKKKCLIFKYIYDYIMVIHSEVSCKDNPDIPIPPISSPSEFKNGITKEQIGIDSLRQIIPVFSSLASDGVIDEMDRIFFDKILSNIDEISKSRANRIAASMNSLSLREWAMLMTYAFTMFLGVLFTDMGSPMANLVMCLCVILSITILSALVADLDVVHSGSSKIDLTAMIDLARLVQGFFEKYEYCDHTSKKIQIAEQGSNLLTLVQPKYERDVITG